MKVALVNCFKETLTFAQMLSMKFLFPALVLLLFSSSCVKTHDCLCVTTDAATGNLVNQVFEYKTTTDKAKIMCSKRNDDVGPLTTVCSLQ